MTIKAEPSCKMQTYLTELTRKNCSHGSSFCEVNVLTAELFKICPILNKNKYICRLLMS